MVKDKENRPNRPREELFYVSKVFVLYGFFAVVLCFFEVRLFFLQIVDGEHYVAMSLNNRQQIVRLPSYRGEILLSDEKTSIAKNIPAYSVFFNSLIFPYKNKDRAEQIVQMIHKDFDIPEETIRTVVNRARPYPYKNFILQSNVPLQKIVYLAEHIDVYPYLSYESTPLRNYPLGVRYGHITGYIKRISKKSFEEKRDMGYHPESMVGVMGLEGFYDLELRGRDGQKVQIVDSRNRPIESPGNESISSIPGQHLILSIDDRVQAILEKMMRGYRGAAIVSKPSTGEILGMYSYPSFDPNVFIEPFNQEKFRAYVNDPDRPFLNRATQGLYPPSSTFKIVVASAALKQGVSFYDKTYTCNGGISIGDQFFGCTGRHGIENMFRALRDSCNTYFYLTAGAIGVSSIIQMSNNYNIGKPTGIDLMYEKAGRLPNQKWKLEQWGSYWWDGDTANMAIGQGFLLTTVLQMNLVINAVINNGVAYKPHILNKILNPDKTQVIFQNQKEPIVNLLIENESLMNIKKALRAVVTSGTARRLVVSDIPIAGKTGTAQNVNILPHSWFNAYAPYDAPADKVISVTVFVENGGGGGSIAAPFGAAIIESVLLGRDPYDVYNRIMEQNPNRDYVDWLKRRNVSP